jgi:hypothetical protein
MQVDELTLKVIAQGLGANDEIIERIVGKYKNEIFNDIEDAYERISAYIETMKTIHREWDDLYDEDWDATEGTNYD